MGKASIMEVREEEKALGAHKADERLQLKNGAIFLSALGGKFLHKPEVVLRWPYAKFFSWTFKVKIWI